MIRQFDKKPHYDCVGGHYYHHKAEDICIWRYRYQSMWNGSGPGGYGKYKHLNNALDASEGVCLINFWGT